jgi:hypothetical protein
MDHTNSICICENEGENKKHIGALDILSKDLGISADALLTAYRYEFDRLDRQAKIRTFLVILVSRRVKDIVKNDRVSWVMNSRPARHE